MIEITEKAKEKIKESVAEHGTNPAVRVYIAGVG